MEIIYLDPLGVHKDEKTALQAISNGLPDSWKGYASLVLLDRRQGDSEIDVVLVTKDRIILVELKNWSAPLNYRNGHWFVGNQDRGQSPVKSTLNKSKKLASRLKDKADRRRTPWVDFCVVLCGSAGKENLPDDEQACVITLEEFIQIGHPEKYEKYFPRRPGTDFDNTYDRPNQHLDFYDKFFSQNSVDFSPKVISYANYIPLGNAIFSHKSGVYTEFESVRKDNKNYKALLRTWDFSVPSIASAANTLDDRKTIGFRESNVLGFVDAQDEDLEQVHLSLQYIPPPEEITSDFYELYEWPASKLRLDEFLLKNAKRLTPEKRIDLLKVFISNLSKLHQIDVAHRDLGSHSIWMALPAKVVFSNFMIASYPENPGATVKSFRELLKNGRTPTPEDHYEDKAGTPFTRDVYLAAVAAHQILWGKRPSKEDELFVWRPVDADPYKGIFDEWFNRALDIDAGARFPNVTDALDSLNRATSGNDEQKKQDTGILSGIYTDQNFYLLFSPIPIASKGTEMLFKSADGKLGIKVWNGVSDVDPMGGVNTKLIALVHRLIELKNSSSDSLLKITQIGLNTGMQALFVVYEWQDGLSWSQWSAEQNDAEQLALGCYNLLLSVYRLHQNQHFHGDISPQNLLVSQSDTAITFVDYFNFVTTEELQVTPEYSPNNAEALTVDARDRYAAVKIVSEAKLGDKYKNVTDFAEELCSQIEVPIGDLERFIDRFWSLSSNGADSENQVLVSLDRISSSDTGQMMSDNGVYYFSRNRSKDNRTNKPIVKMYISGVTHQLDLIIDIESERALHIGYKTITHSQFIRNKQNAQLELNCSISLISGPNDASNMLLTVYQAAGIEDSASGPDNSDYTNAMAAQSCAIVNVRNLWSVLSETEAETFPTVTITSDSVMRGRGETVGYSSDTGSIDFDLKQDKVKILREVKGEFRPVGRLLDYSGDQLHIVGNRGAVYLSTGDRIRLESSLTAASLVKRQRATEQLIQNRSLIADIPDYFSSEIKKSSVQYSDEPTDEELDFYTEKDGDGRVVFSLNSSQRKAFKALYSRGPIGLLQGPPGTGKTAFISSFVHYLVQNGAQRILLVSQSHEAVNNAAEKARAIFQRHGDDLSLIRLGNDVQVTPGLLDVHEVALQEYYREKFIAEFKHRIESLAPTLGLPDQFISDVADFEAGFGKKLDTLISHLSEFQTSLSDDEELSSRFNRFQAKLNSYFIRFEHPLAVSLENISQIRDQYYARLALVHEVDSLDLVNRTKQLALLASEWVKVLSSSRSNFQNFLVKTRTLVCGTCVGIARNHYGIEENTYDWVIIDEAARSSASEMAIAMNLGRRILLVGDHKQLAPIYEDAHVKAASRKISGLSESEIIRSDFERAFLSYYGEDIGQTILSQYRMVKPIGTLISECFYKGMLETGRGPSKSYFTSLPRSLGCEVNWVDTSDSLEKSYEKKPTNNGGHGYSYFNSYEIGVIEDLLQQLSSNVEFFEQIKADAGDNPAIGVICMYAEQKRAMLRAYNGIPWMRSMIDGGVLKIDTVDSYQGKENKVIIISLVRSNPQGTEGFLKSEQRINVAISRAQERVYLVGNSEMWRESNVDSPLGRVRRYIDSDFNGTAFISSNSLRG